MRSPESGVVPLTREEIEESVPAFIDDRIRNADGGEILTAIQRWNNDILESDGQIYLRLKAAPGYLGDLVRGAHWIPLLREWSGREPVIFTNYPQLFFNNKTLSVGQRPQEGNFWIDGIPLVHTHRFRPVFKDDGTQVLSTEDKVTLTYSDPPPLQHLNQLQVLQLLSHAFFGKTVEYFPPVDLLFSPQNQMRAHQRVEKVGIEPSQIPLLIFPDASQTFYRHKRWPYESYGEVFASLQNNWGDRIKTILLTGIDHPQETADLSAYLSNLGVRHKVLPAVKNLGQFAALLSEFAQRRAILLGTESLVAGHLGPVLGIWSVVIGWNSGYNRFYRPVEEGCTTVESAEGRYPTTEQVIGALDYRIHLRFQQTSFLNPHWYLASTTLQ